MCGAGMGEFLPPVKLPPSEGVRIDYRTWIFTSLDGGR
jgi:hypothetical protein